MDKFLDNSGEGNCEYESAVWCPLEPWLHRKATTARLPLRQCLQLLGKMGRVWVNPMEKPRSEKRDCQPHGNSHSSHCVVSLAPVKRMFVSRPEATYPGKVSSVHPSNLAISNSLIPCFSMSSQLCRRISIQIFSRKEVGFRNTYWATVQQAIYYRTCCWTVTSQKCRWQLLKHMGDWPAWYGV